MAKEDSIKLTPGEISVLRALNQVTNKKDWENGAEIWASPICKYGKQYIGIPRGYKSTNFWSIQNVSRVLKQLVKKDLLEDISVTSMTGRVTPCYHNVLSICRTTYDGPDSATRFTDWIDTGHGTSGGSTTGRLYQWKNLED